MTKTTPNSGWPADVAASLEPDCADQPEQTTGAPLEHQATYMVGYASGYTFGSKQRDCLRAALEAVVSLHDQPRSSFTAAEYAAMEQGALEMAREALRNIA